MTIFGKYFVKIIKNNNFKSNDVAYHSRGRGSS